MKDESEFASEAQVRGWLSDVGCTQVPRSNPELDWAYEVDFPPKSATRVVVQKQKNLPRAVLIVSRTQVSPEQIAAFENLEEDAREEFWRALGLRLNNHDYVEYALEGVPPHSCPTAFQIVVVRWDDGLTLDSFARSLSSINKAYFDACAFFHEHLGTFGPATGGEFEFKRMSVQ